MRARKGSGNVFLDIGFDKGRAKDLAVKSDLLTIVTKVIRARGLTQTAAAEICGTDQATICRALSGKLESASIDRITSWIAALGGNVKITVTQPKKLKHGARVKRGEVTVHAA